MKLYLIRHGESLANAALDLDNPTNYYDSKLSKKGIKQAQHLHNKIKHINFDKFYCSPLTRTIQTFSIIFPTKKPIFDPLIREHLFHSCDVGRQPKILKSEFTQYSFDNLSNFWWNNNVPINEKLIKRESRNDIQIRLKNFLLSLNSNENKNIVLVSHGTFLSQITEYMLDNCELFICNFKDVYNKFIN